LGDPPSILEFKRLFFFEKTNGLIIMGDLPILKLKKMVYFHGRLAPFDIQKSICFHRWPTPFDIQRLVYFYTRLVHFKIKKLAYFHGPPALFKFQKEFQQTSMLPWIWSIFDTTKRLMSYLKCRSVEVINNPTRPRSNHREVNCINYK